MSRVYDVDEATNTLFQSCSRVEIEEFLLSGAWGSTNLAYGLLHYLTLLNFFFFSFRPPSWLLLYLRSSLIQHIEDLCCGDTRRGSYH